MIYTLEAAAKKYQLEAINIMELVFLGHIGIYQVGNNFVLKENKVGDIEGYTTQAGISKLKDYDMHEISEEYIDAYDDKDASSYKDSFEPLCQILSPSEYRSFRFLGSELNAVMNGKIEVNFFDKTTAPRSNIQRLTKWNKCIEDTIAEFNDDNGYAAETPQEVIQRLIKKPPHAYSIKVHPNNSMSVNGGDPTTLANLKKIVNRGLRSKNK